VASGGSAVSFFFILSGFILTYTYADRAKGPVPVRSFYVARFARVYPVYALGLLVSAPLFVLEYVTAGKVPSMLGKALAAIFLVQAYVPKLALVWNAPGWSLSDEAFFYAMFPLIARPLTRLGGRAAVVLLGAVWAVVLGIPLLYLAIRPDHGIAIETWAAGTWIDLVRYNPVVRLPEFVLGMLLGHVYLERKRARAPSLAFSGLPELVSALILVKLAFRPHDLYLVIHNGGLAPLFLVLILALAEGGGPLVRLLSTPAFVLLGDASYALYILHEPISQIVKHALAESAPAWLGSASFSLVITVVSVGASVLTARYFERPTRAWLRTALDRSKPGRPAA
jgi:peptidoglycan/LPS O-acetylase OafA/YrhL